MHDSSCRGTGCLSRTACSLFLDTGQLHLQLQLEMQPLDSMLTL